MNTTSTGDVRYQHSDGIASRRVEDEVLLVPIRTDPRQKLGVYTLNRVGAVVWELLDGLRSVSQVAENLCQRFEIDMQIARRDTETFCQALLSFGAIELVSAGEAKPS